MTNDVELEVKQMVMKSLSGTKDSCFRRNDKKGDAGMTNDVELKVKKLVLKSLSETKDSCFRRNDNLNISIRNDKRSQTLLTRANEALGYAFVILPKVL